MAQFLHRLDWSLVAGGGAYMKLHYAARAASVAKIICQGTRFARTLTYKNDENLGDNR